MEDVLQLAALVASYVGVARGFGLGDKWTHVAALIVAAVFVLIPPSMQDAVTTISVVGLTASGAYHYTKKRSVDDDTSGK